MKDFALHYLSRRWLLVYGYLLILLVATPYLPLLIRWASSKWQAGSISSFVLGVEIFIGALLIFLVGCVFFFNRKKFPSFIIIIGGLLTSAILFYLFIPNPYELTHLPEYAILSILIMKAIKKQKGKEKLNDTYIYFGSGAVTGALGAVDEIYQGLLPLRYFTWYDILLNVIGGLLGLIIFWGVERE
ncbi:MAG TPA: VanZ family protein [Desulfatiglandales bacterium]|nr:VanZ family protein [Desulfatiglandales bacterium]